MNWVLITTVLAFIIYFVYNVFVLKFFNIPNSLSNTYYLFKERKNWLKILFPLMMITVSGLLMPAWIDISEGSPFQFLSFIATASLIFTGMAPSFNESKLELSVHMISAIIATICALLWVLLVTKLWYHILFWAILFLIISIITGTLKKCKVYWFETITFLSTFTSIITYYIWF